jgi:hypothetical protein
MTLSEQIVEAFAHRQMPTEVIDPKASQFDSDVEETLWFAGRHWQDVTFEDWEAHSCAIFFLSPEAFVYYLPSLLILSMQHPTRSLLSVDAMVGWLDRSPNTSGWNDHFTDRFIRLQSEEYAVIQEWLLFLSERAPHYAARVYAPGDTFGRAYDTVELLRKETLQRQI